MSSTSVFDYRSPDGGHKCAATHKICECVRLLAKRCIAWSRVRLSKLDSRGFFGLQRAAPCMPIDPPTHPRLKGCMLALPHPASASLTRCRRSRCHPSGWSPSRRANRICIHSSLPSPFSSHHCSNLCQPSKPFDQLTGLSTRRLQSATALHFLPATLL